MRFLFLGFLFASNYITYRVKAIEGIAFGVKLSENILFLEHVYLHRGLKKRVEFNSWFSTKLAYVSGSGFIHRICPHQPCIIFLALRPITPHKPWTYIQNILMNLLTYNNSLWKATKLPSVQHHLDPNRKQFLKHFKT